VFFYYRSLAAKQQREQDTEISHDAQTMSEGRP